MVDYNTQQNREVHSNVFFGGRAGETWEGVKGMVEATVSPLTVSFKLSGSRADGAPHGKLIITAQSTINAIIQVTRYRTGTRERSVFSCAYSRRSKCGDVSGALHCIGCVQHVLFLDLQRSRVEQFSRGCEGIHAAKGGCLLSYKGPVEGMCS